MPTHNSITLLALALTTTLASAQSPTPTPTQTLTGKAALGDWTTDAPGVRRLITLNDLATPYDTPSANNRPKVVKRPENAWPKAPSGFTVTQFATDLKQPRVMIVAPNGDIFLAESGGNQVRLLRDADNDGKPEISEVFATGLNRPFGLALYPPGPNPEFLYVGNTDSVVRFTYKVGDTKAGSGPNTVVKKLASGKESVGGGGHWTRDLEFSPDGKTLFIAIGSRSNVTDDDREYKRACVLAVNPDGSNERIYASGIRNPVGLTTHPTTGTLYASVNERDGLGDNLVPDYITSVKEDGFYGWPWYYLGPIQDPRHQGKRPELKDKVITPEVLLQSHMASIDMAFYTPAPTATQPFPKEYQTDAFAAQHGSWNRSRRVGYKLIRIPFKDNKPTGEYEDFLTGFVTEDGDVWGRPTGVTTTHSGALLVSDDASNSIWRITYSPAK